MTNRVLGRAAAIWILYSLSIVGSFAADDLSWRLIGTVKGPNGGIAICRDLATAQIFSLKIGQQFRGWTLREIEAEKATFEQAGTSERSVITIESPATGVSLSPHSQVPVPQATAETPQAPPVAPQGKWIDGDGQIVDPPKR